MKSSFNFIFLFFLCLSLTQAQGIGNIRVGAKAGLNASSLSGEGNDGDVSPILRFYLGGYATADIIEKLGVQAELIFSAQGAKEDNDFTGSIIVINLGYLNLPVLVRYDVLDQLSVFGGLQFGLNLTSNGVLKDGGDKIKIDNKDDTRAVDVSLVLGGSYEVTDGLRAELRVAPGFININKDPASFFNRVLQIGIAYDLVK